VTASAVILEDRQKGIMVTEAGGVRIWRENTRVGMQDRVRALEEAICQIGVQNVGRMGIPNLYHAPARVRDVFPPRSAQKFRANNGKPG